MHINYRKGILLVVLGLGLLSLPILSIIIGSTKQDDACIKKSSNMFMPYASWLLADGIISLVVLIAISILFFNPISEHRQGLLKSAYSVFECVWFTIGFFLFYNGSFNINCDHEGLVFKFSLSLLVIQYSAIILALGRHPVDVLYEKLFEA